MGLDAVAKCGPSLKKMGVPIAYVMYQAGGSFLSIVQKAL